MAEPEAAVLIGSAEQTMPEVQAENLTPPIEADMSGIENPVPDISDAPGEVVVTSNVIYELFEEKQTAEQEQEFPSGDEAPAKKGRGGISVKEDTAEEAMEAAALKKAERAPRLPKGPQEKQMASVGGDKSAGKEEVATPAEPESPHPPRDATRPGEAETIVYITHADLHPFKGHPFQVRDDDAMKALVESVKERGIDQPALVRPREGGGYELVAGHRRQHAAELAGYANVPCVIRNMTDDEAILAMTESNFNQRAEILPSERAQALKMQLDAIKRQGSRGGEVKNGELSKRSNEIIAERNKMSIKNVQRYIALNNLVPDLIKQVDDKKMKFTVAVELSYIKPKNQRYIAVAIEAQQSAPSGAQAQRMRELDQKNVLNGDVIDGIMLEEKKEENRVILNSQELGKYFGPEKSPREMKDTILKLLDDFAAKQPPELATPIKTKEAEK